MAAKSKKKKKKLKIRPLALCIFRRGDLILVAEGYDPLKDQHFYRPIGGKIEFGEYAIDTVRREVMEEVGQEVKNLRYLGTLENIFSYNGNPGHEIVMMFDGAFVDSALERDNLELTGLDDGDILYKAVWKSIESFRPEGAPPLYPDGLLAMLDALD